MSKKLNIAEVEYINNHKEMDEAAIAEVLGCTVPQVKKIRKENVETQVNDNHEFHPKGTVNPGFGSRSGATVLGPGAASRMDELRGGGYSDKVSKMDEMRRNR